MKSSSGAYYIALDHVRALAAFLVVTWHFIHAGDLVPFAYAPTLFPLALLDEGHTGVSLFMTLSGYLFAKLLNGKSISYGAFIWNRALRLLPLLLVVILIVGTETVVNGNSLAGYAYNIVRGVVRPSLPNGGWSITVESHYYIVLPVFLWMMAKSKWSLLYVVVAAIALRILLYDERGEVQSLAYWTIIGRIDQFALGMLAYQFRSCIARRNAIALTTIVGFMMVYWYFDLQGGFYEYASYPSTSCIWVILPTVEGIAYAVSIAWYENRMSHATSEISGLSKFVGYIGTYSYSIYLLHFFVVRQAAGLVNEQIMDISNFYFACLWSLVFFVLMVIPGYLSFRFIETPFLKRRMEYVKRPLRTENTTVLESV